MLTILVWLQSSDYSTITNVLSKPLKALKACWIPNTPCLSLTNKHTQTCHGKVRKVRPPGMHTARPLNAYQQISANQQIPLPVISQFRPLLLDSKVKPQTQPFPRTGQWTNTHTGTANSLSTLTWCVHRDECTHGHVLTHTHTHTLTQREVFTLYMCASFKKLTAKVVYMMLLQLLSHKPP